MTDHFIALEQRLIESYHAQLQRYDRALDLVAQPAPEAARKDESVHDLNAILNDIAALDADLAEDKAVWRFSGCQPGPQLREVLDSVADRIRALAALVDRRFVELQSSKQALMPEVDECIQQRRMLHAYGKSN
jgi:hypothetical protein